MQKFFINLAVDSLAVLLCAYLLPGVDVDGVVSAIIVALLLALLNQFVKPLLVLFTIPITLLTFGLFLLVINALIILLGDWLIDSFVVDGFWWALAFSLVLAFVKSLMHSFQKAE